MYKNEGYFYEKIANYLKVNIPKSYGIIKTEDDKIGIILEDLFKYQGKFDINLNKDINNLLNVVKNLFNMHYSFYFKNESEIIDAMKPLKTVKDITHYKNLVEERFDLFLEKNKLFLTEKNVKIMKNINNNFDKILSRLSNFPLNFCHGDLKSPNIFYKNNNEPYFLDWQYIHLNKGVSDLVFLLVESLNFDENICLIVEKYYYQLILENNIDYNYDEYINDFKTALCMFPFFVCVWFNSEEQEKLIDKVFPIKFMKNLLKYYDYYLNDEYFNIKNK